MRSLAFIACVLVGFTMFDGVSAQVQGNPLDEVLQRHLVKLKLAMLEAADGCAPQLHLPCQHGSSLVLG
jgi:hypothetical protein